MDKFLRYWVPVLLYVSLIFGLSSIENLHPPAGLEISDKVAHLTEYGLLGFLLVRALRGTNAFETSLPAALVSLLCGLAVGFADELYQAHVPGRSSDPGDYAADATGVVLSLIVFLALRVLRRRRRAGTDPL